MQASSFRQVRLGRYVQAGVQPGRDTFRQVQNTFAFRRYQIIKAGHAMNRPRN